MGTCEHGLLVTHVEENSIADLLGMFTGDIIFKVARSLYGHGSNHALL